MEEQSQVNLMKDYTEKEGPNISLENCEFVSN